MNKLLATLLFLLLGTPVHAAETELRAEIASARARVPQAFAQLDALRSRVVQSPPPFERRGMIGRAMKALGADGLFPLLALLGDGAALKSAPGHARQVLLVGALEAIGAIGDRRAAPLLRQLVDGPEDDLAIVRAAAEALGTLAGDEEVAFLNARATTGNPRELLAIAGLAYCRRPAAAAHLAARLDSHPDAQTAAALADAAGFLGSSWAWVAYGPSRAAEGDAIRAQLADTLLRTFTNYPAPTRDAAARALLMVDHATTPNRLASLPTDPALAADIQQLQRRWLRLR